jgi:hypothetical protein
MPTMPRLNLVQKQAIIAAHLMNMTYPQIAKKVEVSPASVQRVVSEFKRHELYSKTTELGEDIANYKAELKLKSVEILKTALTRTEKQDVALKAAPIAVQVLKGIGEFDIGQAQAGISITIHLPGSLAMPEGACIDVTPEPQDVVVVRK